MRAALQWPTEGGQRRSTCPNPAITQSMNPEPCPSMRLERVLLVDDHEIIRMGLAQVIEEAFEGVQIDTADDVSEGLAQLQAHRYGVVVIDLEYEGQDTRSGLDLVRWMREHRPETPSLIYSGHFTEAMVRQCFAAGAWGCLSKADPRRIDAIKHVCQIGPGFGKPEDHSPVLTDRELQVIELVAEGLSQKEIARKLDVGEPTVAKHMTRIYEKFGTNRSIVAVRRAQQVGVIRL
jgi:DNA-binding NarL/FixJ family response regulator